MKVTESITYGGKKGKTDGMTDGRRDIRSYRVASLRLKMMYDIAGSAP